MVKKKDKIVVEGTRPVGEKLIVSLPPVISTGNQKQQKAVRIEKTKFAVLKELYNEGRLTKTNRGIAKKLHIDHKTSEHHLKSLIKFGLVERSDDKGIYKVTKKGISVVSDGGGTLVVYETMSPLTPPKWEPTDDAHNMKVKVEVMERPSTNAWLEGWFMNDKMKNNCFYSKYFGDIHFKYTKKSLIFQYPRLNFRDSDEATSEILRITNDLCINLEHEIEGLKLGNKKVTCQLITQHHAIPLDPYAVFLKKHNLTYQGVNVDVDASHKNIPETEFKNNQDSNVHHSDYTDFIKNLDSKDPLGYPKFLEDYIKMKDNILMSDVIGVIYKSNQHIEYLSKTQKMLVEAILGTQKQLDNLTKQTTMGVERLSIVEKESLEGYWKKYQ